MPTSAVVQAPTGILKPHPAFGAVASDQPGLYIWHVVKLDLEIVPANQLGTFFTGDCYLILAVIDSKMTDMRIHFWIGSDSSNDEAAVAAMMAVSLDDHFGGAPVQTREVQGAESAMFMQYFVDRQKPLCYLEGGVDSGLRHVTAKQYHTALYQVKGSTKACRVIEVPVSWQSINEGDTFVLDVGPLIFVWKGKLSRTSESVAAAMFAHQLRTDRGKKNCAILITEDGREEADLINIYLEAWNKQLPLRQKKVKSASTGGDDTKVVQEQTARIKLYCCKEQNGGTSISQVKTGPLERGDLRSEDAFIVDNGPAGVWAWIGKTASANERRFAMHYASAFAKDNKYPASTHVAREIDGAETAEFRTIFAKWPQQTAIGGTPYSFNKIAKPSTNDKFDAKTLHDNRKFAAESQMFDGGKGEREIYRLERKQEACYQLVKQDKAIFYGGDCYLVVYTTEETKQTIIYYWIGRHSSQDEQAAAASHVVELSNLRFRGHAMQVRVCQAKEPRHLLAIFGGLLTIFDGGKAGWSKGEQDKAIGGAYLLDIHCESVLDRKVIQVPMTAESLNSSDCFVLVADNNKSFIWCGNGALESERQLAGKVAESCLPNVKPAMVEERKEAGDFWTAVGGQKPYASSKALTESGNSFSPFSPRLFQCTNRAGGLTVNEVAPFTQDDLVVDDVMLLDANDAIFVWIGNDSNKQEREFSLKIADDYMKTDPRGRDANLPIFVIKQGFEPPSFTGFFIAWDSKLWSNCKTYEQLKAEFGNEAKNMKLTADQIEEMKKALGTEPDFTTAKKFPYDKLTVPVDQLPGDVSPAHREKYLAPDEFVRLIGMPYEQFAAKPAWQRTKLKKSARLF